MKIVVTDGYALNPGDLEWDGLRQLGECTVYDRTTPDEVVQRCRDAEIILTNKVVLDEAVLNQLKRARYIGVLATGYNMVDVASACRRGITVTNVPEYGIRSVAQMTFALLLELTNAVGLHWQAARSGRWSSGPDFSLREAPLLELDGLTLGIVGVGRIGRTVAQLAVAFGMSVLGFDPDIQNCCLPAVRPANLETLLVESDVVSLHCPLTAENERMINRRTLTRMKQEAFFLNTSRGGLVNEEHLAWALNSGRIAGAGLDVLSVEPPPLTNPLLRARNCVVTPHIAWATGAARRRLMETAVANVRAFLQGRPENVVLPTPAR